MADIKPGMKGHAEMYTNHMVSAAAVHDGLVEVFGTPFLVMLMENASINAVEPYYEEGEGSVGMQIDVTHSAATAMGKKVWADAEITEVKGKIFSLKIEAFDDNGKIADATHKRAIINPAIFMEKLKK